jgi:flavodoxin
MKKAIIIYNSKKGTTKYFGEEIAAFLIDKNIDAKAISIYDAKPEIVNEADYVLLGAWTHGMMIVLQHPDKPWVKFAKQLPDIKDKKVGLFTTYKIATGSMFRKMKKHLSGKISSIDLVIKSKNEELNNTHKSELISFISN